MLNELKSTYETIENITKYKKDFATTEISETRITNHAAQRTKERLGISKRISKKNADKALQLGIRHSDTSGSLHRYIDSLYLKQQIANNIRIYCNNVYIFHDDTLITVFPLPQKYRKTADKLRKEKQNDS